MKLTARIKRMPSWLKVLTVLILAALILLAIGFAVDRANRGKQVFNSSYSVDDDGLKGLYLSAERYLEAQDIHVERFAKSARFLPEGSGSMVVVSGNGIPTVLDSFEMRDLQNYLAGGGTLVEVGNEVSERLSLFSLITDEEGLEFEPELKYGLPVAEIQQEKGRILCVKADGFTNGELKENANTGARILLLLSELCSDYGIGTVLFDDYYAGVDENSSADVLGYGMILAGVELALCILAFLIAVGGRFGAPDAVPALEKRSEQEPVEALAGMYERAGGGVNIFKVHMEVLLEDLKHYTGLPDRASPDDVLAETRDLPKLKALGAPDLLEEYIRIKAGGHAAFTKNQLNEYVKKIDGIREELR